VLNADYTAALYLLPDTLSLALQEAVQGGVFRPGFTINIEYGPRGCTALRRGPQERESASVRFVLNENNTECPNLKDRRVVPLSPRRPFIFYCFKDPILRPVRYCAWHAAAGY